MLRSVFIYKVYSLIKIRYHNYLTVCLPGFSGDISSFKLFQFSFHCLHHGFSECLICGAHHALCIDITGTCYKVNSHLTITLSLGLCHETVARPNDHIHRGNLFRSIGKSCDRLGPAHCVDLIHTCNIHGSQCLRINLSGSLHDRRTCSHTLHAGSLGRNDQHKRCGIKGIISSRHITTAGFYGNDPVSQKDSRHRAEVFKRLHRLPLGFGKCLYIGCRCF